MDVTMHSQKNEKAEQEIVFITGIGTEVGKTVCSAILTKYFNAEYCKPVQSGDLDFSDSMKIKSWAGEETICHPETYRLKLAASPHQSAREEGITIDLNNFKLPETHNNVIVEGAGGLMVPLNDEDLMIDLIQKLNVPVAMVVKNYLGCINHTLLSLTALEQKKVKLKYIVLNGNFPPDTERIILKNIQPETKIIRIPFLSEITNENIETAAKQLEKI